MGSAIALLVTMAAGAASLRVLYSLALNFQPSRKKLQQDLLKLKEEVKPLLPDLVPLSAKELENLSYHLSNFQTQKRGAYTAKGIFTSIYTEPMVAWTFKRYISPNVNAILYVRTSEREFVYRITKKSIEVAINTGFAGLITPDGQLLNVKRKKRMALLRRPDSGELKPVFVGDKEVASIVKPGISSSPYPRVFEFVTPMSTEERDFLLALSFCELILEKMAIKEPKK